MDPHEFEIALHFALRSRDPSRIFYGMGDYIDSIALLDSSLLSTFDAQFESHLELQDIQTGSIRAMISRFLRAIDDDALRAGKWNQVIGRFLHRGKYSLLEWCAEHDQIDDANLIESKVNEINQLAESTKLQHIPAYRPFTRQALITSVQGLMNAGKILQVSDKVVYRASGEEIEISRTVSFAPELLDQILKPDLEPRRQKAVVAIKKLDFLGNSQWEFKLEGHIIRAHILDQDWIMSFRNRQFEIKPGDALRVILDTKYRVDESGRPKEPQYEVVEVLGIVQASRGEQQTLFD